MNFFEALGTYDFLVDALLAAVLSGVACGIVGTYVVTRRLVFLGGGITHASFGGIGIAYHFGLNPIGGAMIFAILSALGIEWAGAKGRIREDSAIGIVWSLGMAIGTLFIFATPGYAPNLMSFLFGDVLTVGHSNIVALEVLVGVLCVVMLLWYRPVMWASFDKDYARSQGVRADLILTAMTVLTAITIVLSIRIVGIVLLISLLTVPAVIASALTKSYPRILLLASLFAVVGNVVGLWVAYEVDFPVGATTIILLGITLFIVKLLTLPSHRRKGASKRETLS
ncbi:MAG: metal ABC transporter permease [Tidjanibacter sp.]|nr:metal ABC transporter permease [Tidjanibacter sp.]MBR3682179.1 metal ABC transporter permease [Tidjanibacter sp.]